MFIHVEIQILESSNTTFLHVFSLSWNFILQVENRKKKKFHLNHCAKCFVQNIYRVKYNNNFLGKFNDFSFIFFPFVTRFYV